MIWTAFLVPFGWVGLNVRGAWPFLVAVGIFGLCGLIFWVRWSSMLLDLLRYGNSFLTYESFPFSLGGTLRARLRSPHHVSAIHELTLTLRCVQDKYVTTGTGENRSSSVVCYELYKDVAHSAAPVSPVSPATTFPWNSTFHPTSPRPRLPALPRFIGDPDEWQSPRRRLRSLLPCPGLQGFLIVKFLSRKTKFTLGVLLALLPVVLWIVLPASLFVSIAVSLGTDDRLVHADAFMLGAISELVAIYFLKHSRKLPWDWLSAFSLIGAILSGLAIFVFFGAASAVAMQAGDRSSSLLAVVVL